MSDKIIGFNEILSINVALCVLCEIWHCVRVSGSSSSFFTQFGLMEGKTGTARSIIKKSKAHSLHVDCRKEFVDSRKKREVAKCKSSKVIGM